MLYFSVMSTPFSVNCKDSYYKNHNRRSHLYELSPKWKCKPIISICENIKKYLLARIIKGKVIKQMQTKDVDPKDGFINV
jgi:hypothetical protein